MLAGRLLLRPNRFLGVVELLDGQQIEAHIADRGRLEGILFPGAEVYVVAVHGPKRRTAFALQCARGPALRGAAEGPLICLDPAFSNRLVAALIEARLVPELPTPRAVRAEVRHGGSRFDFLLELSHGRKLWLEVKNAAAAQGRAALFPDAPSLRASRHCDELAALARGGAEAAIVLLAQRADVEEIRPHPVDPAFAAALSRASAAGVRVLGVAFEVHLDGFHYRGTRPVRTAPPAACP